MQTFLLLIFGLLLNSKHSLLESSLHQLGHLLSLLLLCDI